MKKLASIAFTALSLALAHTALADPIIVVRPQIGSGTAGVLPQAAFTSPSAPGTPGSPTTPTSPTTPPVIPPPTAIFTSTGYGASLPSRIVQQNVNGLREYHIDYGFAQGYYYCTIVDDAGKTLSSKIQFQHYMGTAQNTPTIIFKPLQAGILRVVLSCGVSSAKAAPVEKFEITAK